MSESQSRTPGGASRTMQFSNAPKPKTSHGQRRLKEFNDDGISGPLSLGNKFIEDPRRTMGSMHFEKVSSETGTQTASQTFSAAQFRNR